MRAVVATAVGGPDVLRVEEVADPVPGPGQVSIDVAYAGVNFAEVMGRQGRMPNAAPPFVPGLEVSGHVRALGREVTGLRLGDPVCALTSVGGYAEIAVAQSALTFKVPGGSSESLRMAATLPTIVPTAWALIREAGRLRRGEDVLISAASGGVGTVAAQVARLEGARRVFGTVGTEAKAEYAKPFGYDAVFVGSSWGEDLSWATDGRGVDVLLDSIGGAFRDHAFASLAPLGRLVIFGIASGDTEHAPGAFEMRTQCKSTIGFSISGLARLDPQRLRRITEEALEAAHDGRLRVDITEEFDLADAWRAQTALEDRESMGKLVLAVSPG